MPIPDHEEQSRPSRRRGSRQAPPTRTQRRTERVGRIVESAGRDRDGSNGRRRGTGGRGGTSRRGGTGGRGSAGFGSLGDLINDFAAQRAAREGLLDFGSGVELPGPVLAALPDRNAYIAPYQQAANQARQVYAEAVPQLQGIYSDLQGALAARQGEAAQRAAQGRQQAATEQSALMQQAQALTTPTGLAQQLGATEGAQAQAAADQAFLAARAADNAALGREMEAVDQVDSAARQQDTEALRAGSLATAKTNLDALLQQIGVGQAEAERQHAADTAEVNARNSQAQQEYALMRHQLEQEQLQMAQEREQMWADTNERIAQTSTTSGRQRWEQQLDARMRTASATTEVMLSLIDEAGEGPTGRARALQLLQENWDELNRTVARRAGRRMNPRNIRSWIDDYYDEQEYVDPAAYAELGGDPTYLPVRQRYA